MILETRRFRRKVAPFDDVEVQVDLQDALVCGRGRTPAPYVDVYPLADWIEDGWVRLRVVAPHHLVPKSLLTSFDDPKLLRHMSGGSSHRSLCAVAASYLTAIGKDVLIRGDSSCSYAGGWADVAAQDGSIYVECGTLNTRKPIDAMLSGETLMVLPYTLGCDLPDEETIAQLDPFPERDTTDPYAGYLRLGRVQLGYIFEPKCTLRPSPFKAPLGLRERDDEELS